MLWKKKGDFKRPKFKTKTIDVPEWPDDDGCAQVMIRELSAYARDQFEAQAQEKKYENARALYVCKCLVDEDGKRIYQDRDADAFGREWPSSGIDRVWSECVAINAKNQDMKELEKNSLPATDANASSSPSP